MRLSVADSELTSVLVVILMVTGRMGIPSRSVRLDSVSFSVLCAARPVRAAIIVNTMP